MCPTGWAQRQSAAARTRVAGLAAQNELARRRPSPAWSSGVFNAHEAYHLQPASVRTALNVRAGQVLAAMHAEKHRRSKQLFEQHGD